MKTLSDYKKNYKRAKTNVTRTKVMNLAMLNLSTKDQQKFISWQTKLSKS